MYTSLRSYNETAKYGYLSLPHHLTFTNFRNAFDQANMVHFFWNSVIVTAPAVVLTLFFASCVAFVLTRFSFWFNIPLLIIFAAGNLLPPQVLITPLYRIYLTIHLPTFISSNGLLYNSYAGLIVINMSFQLGFCVFVLSNYMKSIPFEITEAALLDGASVFTRFWNLTLPLCRPALAALATLLTTWIYNDFFWAITLISSGNKRPDHVSAGEPPGPVLRQPEPARRRRAHHRGTHAGRLRLAAEAIHRRPVARFVQGLSR